MSKFAYTRQGKFAHLHACGAENIGMGIKQNNPRAVLAHNLKALMEHQGLNQTSLGKRAKIDQSTIGRIKKEKHAPDLDTLGHIAQALGVTVWQLMVPDLDVTNLPILQDVSPRERELYNRFRAAAEALVSQKGQ